MSSLLFRALMERARKYPGELEHMDELYQQARTFIDRLALNPEGEIVGETEAFRCNLRDFDLAMKICANFAEGLASDLKNDLTVLSDYGQKAAADQEQIGEQIERLTLGYSRVKSVMRSCQEYRQIVERARAMIPIALGQKSVKRLTLMVNEIKNLDNEVR